MLWNTLFLLLPVAAVSGWWLGWCSAKKRASSKCKNPSSEYFKGLNYLINEQPDHATSIFLKVLDVNSETIEVHYALASLFLKRGEVDRAIHIYQNLLARPTLNKHQRSETLYYLAQGYLKAGVLDRAEGLLNDLVNDADYALLSLKSLLNIFQQQREWSSAIDVARRLQKRGSQNYSVQIAHYYCELAEQQPTQSTARSRALKAALSSDRNCVRASLMQGDGLLDLKRYSQALNTFKKIEQQDASFIYEALPAMLHCWELMEKPKQAMAYLNALMAHSPSLAVLSLYAELGVRMDGSDEFKSQLKEYVLHYPSLQGVLTLLKVEGVCQPILEDRALMNSGSSALNYRCSQCGFQGHSLHWQCPSCQTWGQIRRINDIA
ncbi:MAG: lipopolysaccharide assembly protein LapB [Gammaproteobacteria bacterium]|nr:lipopolysaccharide assembly protein LapB [Gammaproteobacteria bacterium]MCF6231227.1 lipopolysaccharide assembly protein LapB [Gammaproteobacteria bacterium]